MPADAPDAPALSPAASPAPPGGSGPAAAGLVATELAKRYRKRTVVQGVSVHVAAGEIVGLLGPNGAGKTTSFYMITGLVPADGGTVTLDGRDITHLPMHARARAGIGYLPQEASIFQKLTVADNILAILELRDDLDAGGRAAALARLLEEFRLGHVRDSLGKSLSGGERRRVEIARALAAEPRFVLLDEPFANIDPITVGEIQKLVASLAARGLGVLITDHNVRETLSICTRAYILAEGRVIAEGTPAAVLADPTVRRVYLGEGFRL